MPRDAPPTRIAAFTEVVRTSPDYLPAHYNLGNALLAAGRPAEAIAQFRVRAGPHAAGRGGAQRSRQRAGDDRAHAGGAARARTIAAVNPANAKAHYNLGLIAAQAGRMADAEAHFERALAIDPSDPDIAQALAQARAARKGR